MEKEKWFGKVVRWRDGERLHFKNDFVTLVYVATDDTERVGQLGLHGDDQMCVQFIDRATADKWPFNAKREQEVGREANAPNPGGLSSRDMEG